VSNRPYLKDISHLLFGSISAQAIALFFMPILTRLYTPEQFGIYSYQVQVATGLGLFIAFRLENVIQIPNKKIAVTALYHFITFISVLTFIVFFLVFSLFHILNVSLLGLSSFEAFTCLLLAWLITHNAASQGLIQWSQKYSISGFGEIANKSTYVFFSIFSLRGFDFYNQILGHGLGLISKQWVYSRVLQPYETISRYSIIRGLILAKRLWSLASSVLISHIFLIVTTIAPMFFVKEYFSGESLGFYSLTIGTLFLPTMLISVAVGSVYFERGIKIKSSNEPFMTHWLRTVGLVTCLALPIFSIPLFFGEDVYALVFGNVWRDSGTIAAVLSIPAMLGFVSSVVDRTCIIAGNIYYGPLWHLLRAISMVAICIFSKVEEVDFEFFLILLSVQMSFLYVLDVISQLIFARNIEFNYE
jgi:O-antigen/teichoic acid export membrane protein